jgi:uncharacterized protein (TIGR00369 family)
MIRFPKAGRPFVTSNRVLFKSFSLGWLCVYRNFGWQDISEEQQITLDHEMKQINPAHVRALTKTVNRCPYFQLLSIEMESFHWGESHLEVAVQEKHLQPYGIVHGGVCASLVDAAAFWAVYTQTEADVGLTTVEIKVNYLAPVSQGRLFARGKSIKTGSRICLGEATVEDADGLLLAHGTSTMMVLDSLRIKNQSQLPPKFLPERDG